ncbi:MAG: carboxymuconolactone decarboxylase family protein [Planctomycetota bacterium]
MSQATAFDVPTREHVSEKNQAVFDKLTKSLGMVPNIYATLAHSDSALGDFLTFDHRKTSLSPKEREVVNLVTSEINGCSYCLAAHTMIGQKVGFSADEVLKLRRGRATFDPKLDALAQFVHSVVENRGRVSDLDTATLMDAGYTEESVVDIVLSVVAIMTTNYLHNITDVPVDFPAAPAI